VFNLHIFFFSLPKGVDFLSKCVVKSYFRERPAMIRRRTPELALLNRVEIPKHPLRAEAYSKMEFSYLNSFCCLLVAFFTKVWSDVWMF
jgi:hypothetical protein